MAGRPAICLQVAGHMVSNRHAVVARQDLAHTHLAPLLQCVIDLYYNYAVVCCAAHDAADASTQGVCLPVRLGPMLLSRLKAEAKDCCTCEEAGRD